MSNAVDTRNLTPITYSTFIFIINNLSHHLGVTFFVSIDFSYFIDIITQTSCFKLKYEIFYELLILNLWAQAFECFYNPT